MNVEKWKEKIEEKRLENHIFALQQQRNMQAEYDAYVSSRRSYSYEEMRDYGHTWGPGFEPEISNEVSLPERERIEEKQLEILEKMVAANIPEEIIERMYLGKCAWDDEYPVLDLENLSFESAIAAALERLIEERDWYKNALEEKP